MGTETIPTRSQGATVNNTDQNLIKSVLAQDIVPRNTSGVATDQGGSLGTTVLRWLNFYISKIFLGVIANGLSIEASGTTIIVKVGGSTVASFDSTGMVIDSSIADRSIIRDKIEIPVVGSSGTVTQTITGATYADVTGLTTGAMTITGPNPVLIFITSGGTGDSNINQITDNTIGRFQILRDATVLGTYSIDNITGGDSTTYRNPCFMMIDSPAVGSRTFKVQAKVTSGSLVFNNVRIRVVEL